MFYKATSHRIFGATDLQLKDFEDFSYLCEWSDAFPPGSDGAPVYALLQSQGAPEYRLVGILSTSGDKPIVYKSSAICRFLEHKYDKVDADKKKMITELTGFTARTATRKHSGMPVDVKPVEKVERDYTKI
jgi:hypothetical protein